MIVSDKNVAWNTTLSQLRLESVISLMACTLMAKRNQIHQGIEVSDMKLSCQNSWALQSQKIWRKGCASCMLSARNIWAISETQGSRKGHQQIWEGPIAYRVCTEIMYGI